MEIWLEMSPFIRCPSSVPPLLLSIFLGGFLFMSPAREGMAETLQGNRPVSFAVFLPLFSFCFPCWCQQRQIRQPEGGNIISTEASTAGSWRCQLWVSFVCWYGMASRCGAKKEFERTFFGGFVYFFRFFSFFLCTIHIIYSTVILLFAGFAATAHRFMVVRTYLYTYLLGANESDGNMLGGFFHR